MAEVVKPSAPATNGTGAKAEVTKVESYARRHWKELLALALAAIPVAFLLLHKGAQNAASKAITYLTAPGSGGSGISGDPTSPGSITAPITSPAGASSSAPTSGAASAAVAGAVRATQQALSQAPLLGAVVPPPETPATVSVAGASPNTAPAIASGASLSTYRATPVLTGSGLNPLVGKSLPGAGDPASARDPIAPAAPLPIVAVAPKAIGSRTNYVPPLVIPRAPAPRVTIAARTNYVPRPSPAAPIEAGQVTTPSGQSVARRGGPS